MVGAYDDDAAGRVVGNLVRDAPEEEPRPAPHSAAADDQQVRVLLCGDGDQRLGGAMARSSGGVSRRCVQAHPGSSVPARLAEPVSLRVNQLGEALWSAGAASTPINGFCRGGWLGAFERWKIGGRAH